MSSTHFETWIRPSLAAVLMFAAVSNLRAQDAAGGMPTISGKGKVTDTVNGDTGAIFDIGGGVTMLFPKGLPVGRSRLVTLQKAKGRVPTQLAHPHFKAIGPALDFSGAFNTARNPIVVALAMKGNPVKGRTKLVLAMEVGTFCEGPSKAYKLKTGGLCSGFELIPAEYDAESKRIVANVRTTGGLRMQFGLVPDGDE
jgi:hypothetical protein